MKKRILSIFVCFSLILVLPVLLSAKNTKLTILHANDTHSAMVSFGPRGCYGGIARMATLINRLKAKHSNVLVFHAGDVWVGSFEFNAFFGYPELKIMEGMYDVMCLGNHELDLGLDTLFYVLNGAGTGNPVNLPILCANINLGTHPLSSFIQPWIIKEIGDLKIGIFGIVTTDPENYSPEINAVLTDAAEAAGNMASYLRDTENCDVVICLSHCGKGYDEGVLFEVPGIDIIVGGHSHDAYKHPVKMGGKIIVQAGAFGKHLGELNVQIKKSRIKFAGYKLHNVNLKIPKNPMVQTQVETVKAGVNAMFGIFGDVYADRLSFALKPHEEIWEDGNPYRDTPLGNLIADALKNRLEYRGSTVDIALEAMGYIAHKLYIGKIVGNDIMRAVPYGYDPSTGLGFKIKRVLLHRDQILAGLEFTVSNVENTDNFSLQVSGLSFEYDSSLTPVAGSIVRVDPFSVMVNGVSIFASDLYWVAMNEQLLAFLENLGLVPLSVEDPGVNEFTLVYEYVQQFGILSYDAEGRIIDRAIGK